MAILVNIKENKKCSNKTEDRQYGAMKHNTTQHNTAQHNMT